MYIRSEFIHFCREVEAIVIGVVPPISDNTSSPYTSTMEANPPVLVIHIEVDQKQSDLPTTF